MKDPILRERMIEELGKYIDESISLETYTDSVSGRELAEEIIDICELKISQGEWKFD